MYEKLQIESLLQTPDAEPQRGVGLFLIPDSIASRLLFDLAVAPAMMKNELDITNAVVVFNSSSNLREVTSWLKRAELIVADLSDRNFDLMYVLGLAHGLGRCPLLLVREPTELPFNLAALRWLEYEDDQEGLIDLRDHLTRAIRVFLSASRGSSNQK